MPAQCSLRIGIFGAEPWTEAMRAEIEGRLGLAALDIYGLSEVMGPGVAQECVGDQGRPHAVGGSLLSRDHRSGDGAAACATAKSGELVLTTLTKEAMPVIRYRTRDLTGLLPGTARRCGAWNASRGRSDDMLIIRGVNVFPSQIEAVLAQEKRLAPHYMLELRRPDRLDELDVVVETRPIPGGKLQAEELAELEREAEHLIKAYVGVTTSVRVVEPGTIERSQGKAKRVLDLRPRN